MEAIFKSTIPFAESDAFVGTPPLWEMRGENFVITFAIPLFTFNKFELFRRITQGIKMRLLLGKDVEVSIDRLLANSNDENLKTMELLNYALNTFKEEHGGLPTTFTDLLIDLSEPVNLKLCVQQMELYFNRNGIPWIAPDNPREKPGLIREALKYIASNTLSVESIVKVLYQIEQVNIEVKKKLQVGQREATESPLKRQRRKLLSRLLGKS